MSEEKYLAPARIFYLFFKSVVNLFVVITSTFLIAHLIHF